MKVLVILVTDSWMISGWECKMTSDFLLAQELTGYRRTWSAAVSLMATTGHVMLGLLLGGYQSPGVTISTTLPTAVVLLLVRNVEWVWPFREFNLLCMKM